MSRLNRRRFMQIGLGAAGALAAGAPEFASAQTIDATGERATTTRSATQRAYAFMNQMMDAYQQGNTLRLVQSYSDQQGLGSTAFTYDNALTILAYLARGTKDDIARARLLGDSLLYAQNHDPQYSDGRLRQAYWVGPFEVPGLTADRNYFIKPDGTVNLVGFPWYFVGSAVGDMAWAAIALAQLAATTRDARYLDGAVRLGEWIVTNTYDTRGPGGYNFGVDGNNNPVLVKSSEHNIDVYGLFTNLLAPLTGNALWRERGEHALRFLQAMWNAEEGFFFTGSNADGVTINPSPLPEDPQSWSYLALLDARYAGSLDWAKTNLATTDTPSSPNASFSGNLAFSGVTFSDVSLRTTAPSDPYAPAPDDDAVWFEGTAQLALALVVRNAKRTGGVALFGSDRELADYYLANIQLAQQSLGMNQTVAGKPIAAQTGVVAASSVLNTGFGFSYFPNLHIGATAWYLMAAAGYNPYQLRRGR